MTYLILLIWLLRLITAFVVMTVKIKDHIYYGTKLESRVKNPFGMKPLFRRATKGCNKQILKRLSFLTKKKKIPSEKMEVF